MPPEVQALTIRVKREPRIEGDVAYIPLTKGYEAVIDAADLPLVAGHLWFPLVTRWTVYAVRNCCDSSGKRSTVRMHRQIVGLSREDDQLVDHRDGDGLNNRRKNMRVATMSQNALNARISRNNTSGEKGVYFEKYTGRWRASLEVDGVYVLRKRFKTKEEAAGAMRIARELHHGEFANHG